jgi:hypothetical protein
MEAIRFSKKFISLYDIGTPQKLLLFCVIRFSNLDLDNLQVSKITIESHIGRLIYACYFRHKANHSKFSTSTRAYKRALMYILFPNRIVAYNYNLLELLASE